MFQRRNQSACFSTCMCSCVCPLALQWVTLGVEFHRSGSAGAAREPWPAPSGGRDQLQVHEAPVLGPAVDWIVPRLRKVVASSSFTPLLQSGIVLSRDPANTLQLPGRRCVRSPGERLSQLLRPGQQAGCCCCLHQEETAELCVVFQLQCFLCEIGDGECVCCYRPHGSPASA